MGCPGGSTSQSNQGNNNNNASSGGSPLPWRALSSRKRQGSTGSGGTGTKNNNQEKQSLVPEDSGSDADGEEEATLNNVTFNNNLNNYQHSS